MELEHVVDENEKECWCKPDCVFAWDGRELWVHHGLGEELPPSEIIAQAIADIIADR